MGPRYDTVGYIGLDWFILDLLASAATFIALEKIVPHRREQPILRPDFWHDSRYFIFNHLVIGIFLFISVRAVPELFSWTINAGLQQWFRSLPGVVQFVAVLVTADLMEYATHRAMHEVPMLWRFHAVHHSVEQMDWMAGSRLHFLEPVVTRTAVMLPAFVLGASDTPLLCYIVWAGFQAGLVHSNFGLNFGPLKYLVATPLFHHWHHGSDRRRSTSTTRPTSPCSIVSLAPITCQQIAGRSIMASSGIRCRRGSGASSCILSNARTRPRRRSDDSSA